MKRHILLVTIDSLRADHVRCYGQRDIDTPNLDAFAAAGVRFEHHLSSLSTTMPSHCSLLTGCTPAVHKINWNGVTNKRRRTTLAELVQTHGYRTTAVTSWGGFQNQQVYGFQAAYSEGGAGSEENRGDFTLPRVEAAIERADVNQPQLVWVHLIDPHTPDNCPAPFPQTYEGEIRFVDSIAGRLIDAWDAKFSAEDSLSIVTADHGEHLNDHGIERGHGTLWHVCLRIPLLIRAPGLIESGTVVGELTRQIDVFPTILDYLQLPMPYNVEGMSLKGLIESTDSDLRLIHQGQAMREETATYTIRSASFSFHFSENDDLVHVFDRRRDPDEEIDLLANNGTAGHSVKHSLNDAREGSGEVNEK